MEMLRKAIIAFVAVCTFAPVSAVFANVGFNSQTGVLTLEGSVNKEEVRAFGENTAVKEVAVKEGAVFPADCEDLFSGFSAEKINLGGANTSGVTNMSYMFSNCDNVRSIVFGDIDTSNVTTMKYMFNSCGSLTSVDINALDTDNVTDMSYMFADVQSLGSLDLRTFKTAKVTDMSCMFSRCYGLKTLDVSSFDTSKVESMDSMFSQCSLLEKIDVKGFDTRNVTDMSSVFEGCSSLKSVDVSGFDTSNVTSLSSMFCDCSALNELDLSSFDRSKVKYKMAMFGNCDALNKLTVGEKFGNIQSNEWLPNNNGWYNSKDVYTRVSGTQTYAVITNEGNNTYIKSDFPFGKAGECTWTLSASGELKISGKGAIPDYESYLRPEWYSVRNDIKSVVIEEGVTGIGSLALANIPNVTSVTLPDSLKNISTDAFANTELAYIVVPKDTILALKSIGFGNLDKYTGFVIYGYAQSSAESYAKENEFTFKLLGDVNLDGKADKIDAALILKHVTGVRTIAANRMIVANLANRESDTIDLLDAVALEKYNKI